MTDIIPATQPQITAAVTTPTAASVASSVADKNTIAGNFMTFLQLLTTQLKNQNPLDPLDTNQFTQQLVQFAQVEQQLKSNDQLATLVSLQKTAQATAALGFVGETVVVDGANAKLENGSATWSLNLPKPAVVSINIQSATGQSVFSGNYTMNAGLQEFAWDGKSANGTQWPTGNYKMVVSAKDAGGQAVAVPTEVQGLVDGADLTKNPPVLSIAGQDYTLDKVKRVVRH
jgi:flagellar basal-body rod modification protein FlgD